MILVTGATGHLGSSVIKHLLVNTGADKIAAFARDEDKAKDLIEKGVEVRIGTFDDKTSLDEAMRGIEKVLLISTVDPQRFTQHKNVVDAAKNAGVKHILYTGVAMKDVNSSATKAIMDSHFETEDYIKQSGLGYTFLRNSLYADMIPIYLGDKVLEKGVVFPAGDGKVAYALRREMGEAIANVLLQNNNGNKIYEITAGDLYSFQDIAKTLSELTGKQISYTDIDASVFAEQLQTANVPQELLFIITAFAADIKNHQFEITSGDMENLLGRKPATLKQALQELYKL